MPVAMSGKQTADQIDFRLPDLAPLDDHAPIHRSTAYGVRRGEARQKSRRKHFFPVDPVNGYDQRPRLI